jgi:general secretion pathway protein A
MFLEFFGMREQPFGVTPDPRFLYLSPMHREALASLYYGIEAGRGFLSMIAPPGMGKTTLLFQLLEEFRNAARTAFLFQTQCDSREFIRFLLAELGIETKEQDRVKMHEEFNAVLLREMKAGKRFVVVIDEAQNLDDSVLETVRLLSNFETPRAKLMQIILSGQPELADKLARPNLSQLRQRISILARLAPLSPQHIHEYMQHRLRLSGYSGPPLFLPDAESAIIERSEGIPRTINNLCFNALSLAYALGKRQIDRSLIEEISGDLNLDGIMSHPRAPQFSIPFNSPIFAHTNQWSFESKGPVVAPSPQEETVVPEAAAAASASDTELKHLIEEIGTKIETEPSVPANGNGAKPATVVTAQSAPSAPELKALFTPPAKTTEPKRPPAQSRSAVFTTGPALRSPYLVKKAALNNSRPKVRRMAKPIIFGVLAVDFALGAIFLIHQRSGADSDERPATASVMSMPESSAEDGTLVTEEAERSQSGVPMRVSVPASTMRNNIVRMVPPTKPAGVATSENETVLLNATIGRDGRVRSARVIDGDRQLAKAATDAVLQWRYKPYLVNGQPADVETQITVNFNSAANRPAR